MNFIIIFSFFPQPRLSYCFFNMKIEHRDRERDRDRNRDRDRDRESRGRGGERRSRWGQQSQQQQQQRPSMPEKFGVYQGEVSNIKDFGVFVQLLGFRERLEGLVYLQHITNGRVNDPREFVKRRQKVYVKVMSIVGSKIGLSMKEVDQETGRDLRPRKVQDVQSKERKKRTFEDEAPQRRQQRMSEHERWELNQLIASGVIKVSERPDLDEDVGVLGGADDEAEELEIELNENEPAFLRGQTSQSLDLSPVKVVKNPDGSMHRAALTQSALAKERRELREQQRTEGQDSVPTDLMRAWEDPMAANEDRHLAAEIRGVGVGKYQVPNWRKDQEGKNVAYGKVSKLSIQRSKGETYLSIS